jgi:hypothetical protein
MTISMGKANVDMDKVLVLPKGIDLSKFHKNTADPEKIHAIVTRSLSPEYRHAIILKSFNLLHQKELTSLLLSLETEQSLLLKRVNDKLNIERKVFSREEFQIRNYLNYYAPLIFISMPITEGVSASLFEAMASNCSIVTNIAGNQSWITHRKTDN